MYSGDDSAMCRAFLFFTISVTKGVTLRIFISGGCKNGKSYYAQCLAKKGKRQASPLYYIATMKGVDQEDENRIIRHRQEREGWGFTTVEQYHTIENILLECDHNGSFLLDSLTALLSNEMFPTIDVMNLNAHEQISKGLLRVLKQLRHIVIVSDYIYSDAALYDPLTEKYRSSLAALDCLAAKNCDVVLEVVYAQVIVHKGKDVTGFEIP